MIIYVNTQIIAIYSNIILCLYFNNILKKKIYSYNSIPIYTTIYNSILLYLNVLIYTLIYNSILLWFNIHIPINNYIHKLQYTFLYLYILTYTIILVNQYPYTYIQL
jgi:hypothetical protein